MTPVPETPLAAHQLMNPNPIQVGEDTPLEFIFDLFKDSAVKCITVVDAQRHYVGCITLPDFERSRQIYDLREFITIMLYGIEQELKDQLSEAFMLHEKIDLKAREIMSVQTPILPLDATMSQIAQQMADRESPFMVVLDDEKHVLGLIDHYSLLKKLI